MSGDRDRPAALAFEQLDRGFGDSRNGQAALLALALEVHRHAFGAQHLANERSQHGGMTASLTREDGVQRRRLRFIGPLIEIGRRRSLGFDHRAWRMHRECRIESIQSNVAVLAVLDVTADQRRAVTLCGRTGEDARTSCVAIAVLEIAALEFPFDVSHVRSSLERIGAPLTSFCWSIAADVARN